MFDVFWNVGCERGYRYDNFTYDRGNIIGTDGWCSIVDGFNSIKELALTAYESVCNLGIILLDRNNWNLQGTALSKEYCTEIHNTSDNEFTIKEV